MTCIFNYALLQEIQNNIATLTQTVLTFLIQSNNDDTLLHTLQSTVDSIGAVSSSAETSIANVFLHPTFTGTIGTLNYLDNFSTPQDLENTLDSKLTVDSRGTPVYYANNRKITPGCHSANNAFVNFYSNDNNTSTTS